MTFLISFRLRSAITLAFSVPSFKIFSKKLLSSSNFFISLPTGQIISTNISDNLFFKYEYSLPFTSLRA